MAPIAKGLREVFARKKAKFLASSRFKRWCKEAWRECDFDDSGSVDASEVYIGVLLLYLKISKVVPGVTPPSKRNVAHLVKMMDVDHSGALDQEEFTHLPEACVVGLVLVQAALMYVLGPAIAMAALCVIGD
eukprot:gene9495-51687_t